MGDVSTANSRASAARAARAFSDPIKKDVVEDAELEQERLDFEGISRAERRWAQQEIRTMDEGSDPDDSIPRVPRFGLCGAPSNELSHPGSWSPAYRARVELAMFELKRYREADIERHHGRIVVRQAKAELDKGLWSAPGRSRLGVH